MNGRRQMVVSRYIESTGLENQYTDTVIDLFGGWVRQPTLPAPLFFIRKGRKPNKAPTPQASYTSARRHGRVRRATLLIGAAVAAILACVLIVLDAQAAPNLSTDKPGRPAYACRYKLTGVSPWGMSYVKVCWRVK
jgi:hypothetical protein